MKKTIVLMALFFSAPIIAQTGFKKLIIGTWELQERIDNNPIEKVDIFGNNSGEQKDTEPKDMFFFQNNGKVDVRQFGEQFKYDYQLLDSTLQIGDIIYKVKRLTRDSLILNRKKMLVDENLILTHSKKSIDPIQAEQVIRIEYPSGHMKLRGQKVGGFQNGLWTEWYDGGGVKSVTHYQMDVVFMKIEFDINGKITSKSWYDLESKKMKNE
ncbi:toxin-antitoxin system YwqK family antitoxin [Owenweeksia hongkongensis]|nr:hypothetical protein [Owenweeksia hongkongensis]